MIRSRSIRLWVVVLLGCALVALALARWGRRVRFEQFAGVLERDDLRGLEELLREGVDPNVRGEDGVRPLHLARSAGAVRLLVGGGGRVDAKTASGNTPLHIAAYYADAEVVAELLRSGGAVDARNDEGDTPLHLLSMWIINGDVSPEFYNPEVNRSRHGGAEPGTVDLLLKAGADIEAKNAKGETPAYKAAMGPGRPEVLRELLNRGASTTVKVGGRPMLGDEYSRAVEAVLGIVEDAERKRGGR